MDLKVGAQHAALASQLIHLGYERLMNDGTDFVTALMRSTGSTSGNPNDVQQRARNFYNGQVFGALGKQTYALQNLLAAAKRCVAYDVSRAVKTVMILPHGVPELMAYAKAENMRYEINGLRGPQGKAISMTVDSGYSVPATASTVFVHIPPARHMYNQVSPHAGKNELESEVVIIHRYEGLGGTQRVPNLMERKNETPENGNGGQTHYRLIKLKMMHAILAVPGSDTGSLLMQYPRSTVSADASTESGLMQLRVYMGAVLKRPENVLVMRNVAFNGIVSQTGLLPANTPANAYRREYDLPAPQAGGNDFLVDVLEGINAPHNVYNGTVHDENGNLIRTNDGPLGHLDDVAMAHRIMGSQVYDDAISAAVASKHASGRA